MDSVSLLIGYVFFTIMIQLPERFQIVNGKNPEKAGICLLAVSGASAFGKEALKEYIMTTSH